MACVSSTILRSCLSVLVALLVSVPLPAVAQGKPKCDPFYYYDHGTEHCEHCRDICQYAEIQRTVDACLEQCPDYYASQKCRDDQWYDNIVKSCSPCAELCTNSKVMDTEKDCQEKCPAFLAQLAPEQRVASHQNSNAMKAHTSGDNKSDGSYAYSLHPGYIAAICAGVFILLFIPAFVLGYKHCNQQYQKAPAEDEEQGRRGGKPVEETSQGSGSQHFALPDSASSAATPLQQTGFSDLAAP